MTIRLVKVLAVAIAFGALVNLGAQTAMAKGGGGGHGGGGKHFSGGGGKHFGGHVRGRNAHIGGGRIAHTRAHIHGGKSARVSHTKIGHAHALGAAGALGDGPLGTNGVTLDGGAGGAEDGAVGPDQYSGPTFSVMS